MVKIFMRCKLQSIDENTYHRAGGMLLCNLDQRQVTLMQITHSGYQRDGRFALQAGPQRCNVSNDFHG